MMQGSVVSLKESMAADQGECLWGAFIAALFQALPRFANDEMRLNDFDYPFISASFDA